jgi:hypothetical protein
VIAWHRQNGFDAFFLTEHDHHRRTLEIEQTQREGNLPSKPVLFCGQEFSGSGHILLLCLKRDFYSQQKTDTEMIEVTHAQRGVAIVAHWWDNKHDSLTDYVARNVDGFEIANPSKGLSYPSKSYEDIVHICNKHELVLTGGCDYHGYGSACFVWNAFAIPDWPELDTDQQREAIMNILRAHAQTKLKVLVYRDRKFFDSSLIGLSPLFTLTSYFRTLTSGQLLSWMVWSLFCLLWIKMSTRCRFIRRNTGQPNRILRVFGAMSSVFILIVGVVLSGHEIELSHYNKILDRSANYLVWTGLLGFLYSGGLIWGNVVKVRLSHLWATRRGV